MTNQIKMKLGQILFITAGLTVFFFSPSHSISSDLTTILIKRETKTEAEEKMKNFIFGKIPERKQIRTFALDNSFVPLREAFFATKQSFKIASPKKQVRNDTTAKVLQIQDLPSNLKIAYNSLLSTILPFNQIQIILVPYNSSSITDVQIKTILEKATFTKPEELKPLHLMPCRWIEVMDISQHVFDLCVFPVEDLRGFIILPNHPKIWFALPKQESNHQQSQE